LEKIVSHLSEMLAQTSNTRKCIQLCEKYLLQSLFMLVKNCLSNKDRNPRGFQFSTKIKLFVLTLHFLRPNIFKLLQKYYNLPSIRTLRTIAAKYELKPRLSDFMFNFLSFKTKNFLPETLECIIWTDEMSIKTHIFCNMSKDKIIGLN
jgi:hypothetical protein